MDSQWGDLMGVFPRQDQRLTLAEVEKIPASIPCLMGWKDRGSRYLGISDTVIAFSGLEPRENILGKSDRDIERFAPVADFYMQCDQIAMTMCPYHGYEKIVAADNRMVTIRAAKYPIHDTAGNNVVGVFFIGMPAENIPDFTRTSPMQGEPSPASLRLSGSRYIFGLAPAPVGLTDRESCALYFYIRGRTTREIANQLCLSPRTVEGHLQAIKAKLGVSTRSGLMDLVIACGLFEFVPSPLCRR